MESDINLANSEYSIYDLTGKLVAENKYNGKQIDVSELTSGIYIVLIKTINENGAGKLIIR
ncbi:MAG: T9SS type A sorting domain-containing protein [Bacteroidetes bacterium]|nr:T9SS type A sorting domain-containing protein [Bacteroidota bacterium]